MSGRVTPDLVAIARAGMQAQSAELLALPDGRFSEGIARAALQAVLDAGYAIVADVHELELTARNGGIFWALVHPASCRDRPCGVARAHSRQRTPPAAPGRYRVSVGDDGVLVVGDPVAPEAAVS